MQDRRGFLRLITLTPSVASASQKLLERIGADVNVGPPSQSDVLSKELLPPGMSPAYVDRRSHAYYDLVEVRRGEMVPSLWPLFSEPVGANFPGTLRFKTLRETNMLTRNMLPPPRMMAVERILFVLSPDLDPADRSHLLSSFWWELKVDEKCLARAPLLRAPIYGELRDLVDPVTGRRSGLKVPLPYCVYLQHPVVLLSLQYFTFTLFGEPFRAGNEVSLYVFLDGTGIFPIS